MLFSLGIEVAVNTNILLPTLKQWVRSIKPGTNILVPPDLHPTFNISYKATTAGLPYGITFTSIYFFRPGPITTPTLSTKLNQNRINTAKALAYPAIILYESSKRSIRSTPY